MAVATYSIRVDWDADGAFTGSNEDITSNVMSLRCFRGRPRPYTLPSLGPATPGTLELKVKNHTGLYSPSNSSGALYGNLLPGRKIQVRATSGSTYTLWQGVIDRITPAPPRPGVKNEVTITALGSLSKLVNKKINTPVASNTTATVLLDQIFDQMGLASGDVDLTDVGQTTVTRWFATDVDALTAVRDVEDTEFGMVFEAKDGRITLHDRHHRLTASASTTSQATFSDAAAAALPYAAIEEIDPTESIVNEVVVRVAQYTTGTEEVLWTLAETSPELGPGQTREWIALHPSNSTGHVIGEGFVSEWTTAAVGTDITATGVSESDLEVVHSLPNFTVFPRKTANRMRIRVTNNHASATAVFTLVQARGVPVDFADPIEMVSFDDTSQSTYGPRSYEYGSRWLRTTTEAQAYADYIISKFANGQPALRLTLAANKSSTLLVQALSREIGDRITVVAANSTSLGINSDWFIENIAHTVDMGARRHVTTWELSPADAEEYFILDTSTLDGTDVLGF